MTTITPLRAAAAGATAVAVVALGLGAGFAMGSTRDASSGTARATLPAAQLAAAGDPSGPAAAGITVTGTGTVSGTPDSLRLAMGVAVIRPTVKEAMEAANGSAAALQAELRKQGVAEKDLQTSGLSIQPQYADGGSGRQPTITGYEVSESVTATLRNLKTAGDAISAAARVGGDATRINSVTLDLSDTGALLTSAREKAFAQAKAKAEQYARVAGVSLGEVVSISEYVQQAPPSPVYAADMRAEAAVKAVPIAAGSQEVGVTVTVVYGLS